MRGKVQNYADLDVVNTRKGLRVITDLNNLPNCDRNVMREPRDMALRMSLTEKDTVSFLKTVEENVGTIIRIVTVNHKIKKAEPIREINCHWYSSFKEIPKRNDTFRAITKENTTLQGEALEALKYVSYYEDKFTLLRNSSKRKGGV